jgi:hypothetical protein
MMGSGAGRVHADVPTIGSELAGLPLQRASTAGHTETLHVQGFPCLALLTH